MDVVRDSIEAAYIGVVNTGIRSDRKPSIDPNSGGRARICLIDFSDRTIATKITYFACARDFSNITSSAYHVPDIDSAVFINGDISQRLIKSKACSSPSAIVESRDSTADHGEKFF